MCKMRASDPLFSDPPHPTQVFMLCDPTRQRQEMFEGPGQEGVWVLESQMGAAGAASPVKQAVPCVCPG